MTIHLTAHSVVRPLVAITLLGALTADADDAAEPPAPALAAVSQLPPGAVLLDESSPEVQAWGRQFDAAVDRMAAERDQREATPIVWHADGPRRLAGRWRVSLCVCPGRHAWLRFEAVDDAPGASGYGRVLTLSRYKKGAGRELNLRTLAYTPSTVPRSGVWIGREVKGYGLSRKHELDSVILTDPVVFYGRGGGDGHHGVRRNCVTFARDGWAFYTGRRYPLPTFHSPTTLYRVVANSLASDASGEPRRD